MGVVKRIEESIESVDPLKIFVPDFVGKHKDPPSEVVAPMEQFPKEMTPPEVKVGIMAAEKVHFSFDSAFWCRETNRSYIGDYDVYYYDRVIIFENETYSSLSFSPLEEQDIYQSYGAFTLYDVMIGIGFHWQRLENQSFKGSLNFIVENNKIRAINKLPVEAYLYSVISSEMSATASLELLKAHAVISRSWLLAPMLNCDEINNIALHQCGDDGNLIRWYERDAHANFDVCADDHCQRYQGITRAKTQNVRDAIEATSGEVLFYDNKICDARYSKSCGGVSELFENCWEEVHHPYLQRVVDVAPEAHEATNVPDLTIEENAQQWIRTAPEAFCNTTDKAILSQVLNNYDQETTDFYRWTVDYTTAQLSELLARRSGVDFGEIVDLVALERGVSGRIIKLRIVGSLRTMVVGKELEIRKWLSESHLYSSAFVVDKTESGFHFIGAGWGHGVGLCQIGAAVMGAKGYKYNQILMHYFVGADLKRLY